MESTLFSRLSSRRNYGKHEGNEATLGTGNATDLLVMQGMSTISIHLNLFGGLETLLELENPRIIAYLNYLDPNLACAEQ
jgi:hypothetical protein